MGGPIPTDMQKCFQDIVAALPSKLPCSHCKEHFAKILNGHPVAAHSKSRDELLKWTIKIHNQVNKQVSLELKKTGWMPIEPKVGLDYIKSQCSYTGSLSESLLALRWMSPAHSRRRRRRDDGGLFLVDVTETCEPRRVVRGGAS